MNLARSGSPGNRMPSAICPFCRGDMDAHDFLLVIAELMLPHRGASRGAEDCLSRARGGVGAWPVAGQAAGASRRGRSGVRRGVGVLLGDLGEGLGLGLGGGGGDGEVGAEGSLGASAAARTVRIFSAVAWGSPGTGEVSMPTSPPTAYSAPSGPCWYV